MKFGKEGIPVKVFPPVEADGADNVVWYGFICGTPEFTVSEAIQYLKESEEKIPPNDTRAVVTGIDEIEAFHISGHVPITMVRQALHSSKNKYGINKRSGQKLLRTKGVMEYLALTQIFTLSAPPELVNQELMNAAPFIYDAVGSTRKIISIELYQSINPVDNSYQMLWRFGVKSS